MDVNNLFDRRLGSIIMKEGRQADIQIFNPVFDNNLLTEFHEQVSVIFDIQPQVIQHDTVSRNYTEYLASISALSERDSSASLMKEYLLIFSKRLSVCGQYLAELKKIGGNFGGVMFFLMRSLLLTYHLLLEKKSPHMSLSVFVIWL